MAKGKKGKAKRTARRAPARNAKTAARGKARTAASSATAKRVAQLEAENRRLREELAALRAARQASVAGDEQTDRPPALEL